MQGSGTSSQQGVAGMGLCWHKGFELGTQESLLLLLLLFAWMVGFFCALIHNNVFAAWFLSSLENSLAVYP